MILDFSELFIWWKGTISTFLLLKLNCFAKIPFTGSLDLLNKIIHGTCKWNRQNLKALLVSTDRDFYFQPFFTYDVLQHATMQWRFLPVQRNR